ncbi:hypothetical protein DRO59_09625 [Candidatus Bathyarchaeota archaeon]|nr:MAG: hypothetical protein DRO59_09625 [Candidatus Bathyarchaeota archaeon]
MQLCRIRWRQKLAMIMTPMADMIVEMVKPQKRLNPPLAETLVILTALLTEVHFPNCVFHFSDLRLLTQNRRGMWMFVL